MLRSRTGRGGMIMARPKHADKVYNSAHISIEV
jgi:hypothetical protein